MNETYAAVITDLGAHLPTHTLTDLLGCTGSQFLWSPWKQEVDGLWLPWKQEMSGVVVAMEQEMGGEGRERSSDGTSNPTDRLKHGLALRRVWSSRFHSLMLLPAVASCVPSPLQHTQ